MCLFSFHFLDFWKLFLQKKHNVFTKKVLGIKTNKHLAGHLADLVASLAAALLAAVCALLAAAADLVCLASFSRFALVVEAKSFPILLLARVGLCFVESSFYKKTH